MLLSLLKVFSPISGRMTSSNVKSTFDINNSKEIKRIVAIPLTPGQAIPPGSTVFMAGGKTYYVPGSALKFAPTQQWHPKPMTTVMQNQSVAQTINTPARPILPVNHVPQQQLTSPQQQQSQPQPQQQQQHFTSIFGVQTQNNAGQKQLVEVKVSRDINFDPKYFSYRIFIIIFFFFLLHSLLVKIQ